jgi:putative membrane protein
MDITAPSVGWHADPSVIFGTLATCCWYGWSMRRLPVEQRPSQRQVMYFFYAVVAVVVALASPIHDLGERYLFTAHMAQHLLLTLVMPPLLLASVTPEMVRPLVQPAWAFAVARYLTRTVVAFALCNFVFAVAHLPNLYDLTLRDHNVHVVEHLLFMSTAILLWWPLLSPLPELPRSNHAVQLLYIFLQVLPGSLVGGLIVHTERPLYPFYAAAPRITDLSAVQDQQLGSIVMWVGGGAFWLIAFTVVFFVWAAKDMAEDRKRGLVLMIPTDPPKSR